MEATGYAATGAAAQKISPTVPAGPNPKADRSELKSATSTPPSVTAIVALTGVAVPTAREPAPVIVEVTPLVVAVPVPCRVTLVNVAVGVPGSARLPVCLPDRAVAPVAVSTT